MRMLWYRHAKGAKVVKDRLGTWDITEKYHRESEGEQ